MTARITFKDGETKVVAKNEDVVEAKFEVGLGEAVVHLKNVKAISIGHSEGSSPAPQPEPGPAPQPEPEPAIPDPSPVIPPTPLAQEVSTITVTRKPLPEYPSPTRGFAQIDGVNIANLFDANVVLTKAPTGVVKDIFINPGQWDKFLPAAITRPCRIIGIPGPGGSKPTLKYVAGVTQNLAWQGKSMILPYAPGVEVYGLVFDGAFNSSGNGAGIRTEPQCTELWVQDCDFYRNNNGYLSPTSGEAVHTFIGCRFERNGWGDGDRAGQSHHMYAGVMKRLVVAECTFVDPQDGHSIKSRAKETYVLKSDVGSSTNADGDGIGGRCIDISVGGKTLIEDTKLHKSVDAPQGEMIGYYLEPQFDPKDGRTHALTLRRVKAVNQRSPGGRVLLNNSNRACTPFFRAVTSEPTDMLVMGPTPAVVV